MEQILSGEQTENTYLRHSLFSNAELAWLKQAKKTASGFYTVSFVNLKSCK